MKFVQPRVFHIAGLAIDQEGLQAYLKWVGVPDWKTNTSDDTSKLIEVGGRLCYRSFAPGLNENISKIREGNDVYLANIADQHHGSVIEHSFDCYIFADVSRVFTHEVVRHRVGDAFSQESLRYVRLTELRHWFPEAFLNHPNVEALRVEAEEIFTYLEGKQIRFAKILDLDNQKNFNQKKKLTSAMRRYAPIGLATSIMMSGNVRTWRWLIENRTSEHAEEEIRLLFYKIYKDQRDRHPNLYQDVTEIELIGDGVTPPPEVKFRNSKI